jgi:SNF2 family DNA or RNA helicase
MSAIAIERGRLVAARTPYGLKDRLKAVPGARWNARAASWEYPATPMVAAQLRLVLPEAVLDGAVEQLLAEAEAALGAQVHKTATDLEPIPLTATLPWRHQLQAYRFAEAMPAVMLALDMGVGKSKVVVDLVVNLGLNRALILCPLSVVDVWPGQFRAHAGAPVRVLALGDGGVKEKTRALATALEVTQGPLVVVVNYESAWREPLASLLLAQRWPLVALDESHRTKAPGGKASLFCNRLRERAARRMCLTGTPMPHSPLDLYAQYRFLDPGVFGTSFVRFRTHFAVMGGYQNHQVTGFQHQDELAAKFESLAFRVKSSDVLDLPEVQHVTRTCRLDIEEARVYAELASELIAGVRSGLVTASNALVKLLRLQQVTSGYVRNDEGLDVELGTSKRDLLADVLDDLPRSEPVVVFCRFHHDLDTVHAVAAEQNRTRGELSGRMNDLAAWQRGEVDVLAVQIQSGGVGIDLTRARYCVMFSVGYSLGEYEQALARVHRPGQTRPVVYVHLLASHTVDDDVYAALDAKRDAVEAVLERMKR